MTQNAAPHNTKIISLILRSLNIEECEPKAILQIHEFIYKYATDILRDAAQYASVAERSIISEKDVKLALQTKVSKYFVPPPSRAYMNDIAAMVNSKQLKSQLKENEKLPSGKHVLLNHESKIIDKNEM